LDSSGLCRGPMELALQLVDTDMVTSWRCVSGSCRLRLNDR